MYAKGIESALRHNLDVDLMIRHLTAVCFVATKFEAYLGRGLNDPIGSSDIEDILVVIDGRAELQSEIIAADQDVRDFIASQLANLQGHRDFENLLNGNIRGPKGRLELVHDRIAAIAAFCASPLNGDQA